ncbi:MAG: alpha/beta fold hydrolase [Tumebacillaceae bacterium]
MKFETSYTTLHYEVCGEGHPLVIFPALGHATHVMQTMLEPLFAARTGWKRIYVDLPGMGHSPAGNVRTSDQVLEALLELIDGVLPDERFCIAGMSYGAYLAQGVLQKKQEQIDGMMLLVPLISPTQRNAPEKAVLVRDEALLNRLGAEEAMLFENGFVMQTERNWESYRDVILPCIPLQDREFLTGEWRTKHYALSVDVDRLEQPFTRPVLLLTGRQDHQVGYSNAFQLLDSYPRATFAVLDQAGHYLAFEQQELFGAMVKEWLKRIEQERE